MGARMLVYKGSRVVYFSCHLPKSQRKGGEVA